MRLLFIGFFYSSREFKAVCVLLLLLLLLQVFLLKEMGRAKVGLFPQLGRGKRACIIQRPSVIEFIGDHQTLVGLLDLDGSLLSYIYWPFLPPLVDLFVWLPSGWSEA
jgi:hypothetical protein